MNKATGFAMAPAQMVRATVATVLMSVVLAACGGGAQTVDNPIPNVAGPTTVIYNGTNPPLNSEVQAFMNNFWTPMQNTATCSNCHSETGPQPLAFARFDDINLAFDAAMTVSDLTLPSGSEIVTKVRGDGGANGHNCWNGNGDSCATIMTNWIAGWAGATAGSGGRQIVLTPPPPVEPGTSKNYADATAENFRDMVYAQSGVFGGLELYCSGCHNSASALSQQPYFAESGAIDAYLTAFDAAKPRMDLDNPANSQFVLRMADGHNLWPNATPATAAAQMEAAITAFAATVPTTSLATEVVNSKALRLIDGTIASGGNRYENDQVALWEFKEGTGTTARDTSGVVPSLDLELSGEHEWFGGWGITFRAGDPLLGELDGRAQGTFTDSRKLFNELRATGEYSIEAWVVPANVTQEMARIVTYSGGDTARNFTLQQTLYNYDYQHRSTVTGANGDQPTLSTPDAAEVLQATLQHVVATFSATEGRNIYVNGQLVTPGGDPADPGTMTDWDDTFAFVLGNEAGGAGAWEGTIRMASIHKFALTPAQIQQNFDVGVGEKFYLLFSIEDVINVPTAYILFEVAQFDSYSYLFSRPHFITLDPTQTVEGVEIRGMRIGINGAEVDKSQTYSNMVDTLSGTMALTTELGQPLSDLGAVIPLEKGTGDQGDEFFLTFDVLGASVYCSPTGICLRTDDPALTIAEVDLPPAPRVGVRTFDEINATFAAVTTVNPQQLNVNMVFEKLRQSFPATPDAKAFLSSHQVAIAQLAFEYCSALVDGPNAGTFFNNFDFTQSPAAAYNSNGGTSRNQVIDPLIDRLVGIAVMSQPDFVVIQDELGYALPNGFRPDNLIDQMMAPNPDLTEPQADTRGIAKGVCGAILGSAATLVQ
jgi:hypothetical protein